MVSIITTNSRREIGFLSATPKGREILNFDNNLKRDIQHFFFVGPPRRFLAESTNQAVPSPLGACQIFKFWFFVDRTLMHAGMMI